MEHNQPPGPRAIRFRVDQQIGWPKLGRGDVVVFDPDATRDSRIRLERVLPMHCGQLDKCILSGTIVPIAVDRITARQLMVGALLADRDREAA